MSESLTAEKNTTRDSTDTSMEPKGTRKKPIVAISAAALSAITTILVSFIAIVPQLRGGDAQKIDGLMKELREMQTKSSHAPSTISTDKKVSVHGTVTSLDGKRLLSGVDVFLLPEGNNLLVARTDDSGVFNVVGIPAGTYSIIVRESNQGLSGKSLLDESEDEVQFKFLGARMKYRIRP